MKLNEEKIKDISGDKTFDPIRIILNSEQKKFNEVIRDKTFLIEPLFMINESFPVGVFDFENSLGKTCSLFDTIQVTISLVIQMADNKRLKNLLEDIRMSLQNFLLLLNYKSFYTCFSELRKVLEGVLRIILIKEDEKNLDVNNISENISYSELFKKYAPGLISIWKILSNTAHYNKKSLVFNINIYYKLDDFVQKTIIELQKSSQIIYDKLNLVLDLFQQENKELIERYKKLLGKLWTEREREGYNLIDMESESFELWLDKDSQQLLERNIKSKGNNKEDLALFIDKYDNGINAAISKIKTILVNNYNFLNIKLYYIKLSLNYVSQKLSNKIKHLPILHKEDFLDIWLTESYQRKNRYFENKHIWAKHQMEGLIYFSKKLSEIEIRLGGNLEIAILKSIVEELIFNLILGKVGCYLFFNFAWEFLNKTFNANIPKNENFIKYRHLQIEERIQYTSIITYEKTGEVNDIKDSLKIIMRAINNVINKEIKLLNE